MHAAPGPAILAHLAHFTAFKCRARVTGVRTILTLLVVACAGTSACSRARHYELRGQILAVDRERQEITISHDDIRGFMPAMTMPFKVKDARLLEERQAGDLVTATLVVQDANGYLSSVERTGHAALTSPPPAPRVEMLAPGQPVPDVRLTDQKGTTHSLSAWRGRILAVTFIYTRCPLPDFCPLMDRHFKAVQDKVLADPQLRERVALLSISFDPGFDTPPVLAAHAAQAGADARVWQFLTGEPDAIAAFASRFGTSIIREGSDSADITHNLRTAVIASDGTLVAVLKGADWAPADLMHALSRAR
jgi:protein SCO1/2